MRIKLLRTVTILLLALPLLLTRPAPPVAAQAETCDPVINALFDAIQAFTCQQIPTNFACYGSKNVQASLLPGVFFGAPGAKTRVTRIRSLRTFSPSGAALMYVDTPDGEVKLVLFGNSDLDPDAAHVFTLRNNATDPLCQQTPSGMVAQTRAHKRGRIVVNGVTIRLGSTAFIHMGGSLLFDQDPRIDRRQGRANPNAPLCSGFDSDCDFGNCPFNYRLVWGPFCDEERYPVAQPGAYRVTLYGRGRVLAGATDYGASGGEEFSLGRQTLTLPGSFTFCWPGLQPGGTGFETLVKSRSSGARVDRLTLEYLGANCRAAFSPSSDMELMTITNLDGQVRASIPGISREIPVGQQVRVTLVGGEPVAISLPVPALGVRDSPVLQWLTFDPAGLPHVNEGGSTGLGCGGPLRLGQAVEGALGVGDVCEYTFGGRAGQRISVAMNRSPGSSLDPLLELVDPLGRIVARDDDSGGNRNSLISNYQLRRSGVYTIQARSYEGSSGGAYVLRLEEGRIQVAPPTPTRTPTRRPTITPTRTPTPTWTPTPTRTPTAPPPQADLVGEVAVTGDATFGPEGSIRLPLAVTVINQGGRRAGGFKVAVFYEGEAGAFGASFRVKDQSGFYPFLDGLRAGGEVTLRGALTLPGERAGETVRIWAEVDSCSGDEFMPGYCRVRESSEGNNLTAALRVSLPLEPIK